MEPSLVSSLVKVGNITGEISSMERPLEYLPPSVNKSTGLFAIDEQCRLVVRHLPPNAGMHINFRTARTR